MNLNRFSAQNVEGFGPLSQKPRELVHEYVLDLVRLLDLDGDSDAVDRGLDQDPLVLVAGHHQGGQHDLGGGRGLDLGDIVALGCLGGEIGEAEGGRERAADALEVGAERLRLYGQKERES